MSPTRPETQITQQRCKYPLPGKSYYEEEESIKYPLPENLTIRRRNQNDNHSFQIEVRIMSLLQIMLYTVENSIWKSIVIFETYIGAQTTPQISNNFKSILPFDDYLTLFLINFFSRKRCLFQMSSFLLSFPTVMKWFTGRTHICVLPVNTHICVLSACQH